MKLVEYLLAQACEEAGEIAQAAGKCLRFGPLDWWDKRENTNIEMLRREMTDLVGVFEMLDELCPELNIADSKPTLSELVDTKKTKILKYMKVSRELGILEENTAA